MRISDWSSDVCSSDLVPAAAEGASVARLPARQQCHRPAGPSQQNAANRSRDHLAGAGAAAGDGRSATSPLSSLALPPVALKIAWPISSIIFTEPVVRTEGRRVGNELLRKGMYSLVLAQ